RWLISGAIGAAFTQLLSGLQQTSVARVWRVRLWYPRKNACLLPWSGLGPKLVSPTRKIPPLLDGLRGAVGHNRRLWFLRCDVHGPFTRQMLDHSRGTDLTGQRQRCDNNRRSNHPTGVHLEGLFGGGLDYRTGARVGPGERAAPDPGCR